MTDVDDFLLHYGTPRKSGRYPWGSGEDPQGARSFQADVKDLRAQGLKDPEIAKGFDMTTSEFRIAVSRAKEEVAAANRHRAQQLKAQGLSNVAIGRKMGIPDTTVGNLLRSSEADKKNILDATAGILRDQVAKKKYLDVGKGVELHMGISYEKLKSAVSILQDEGYVVHRIKHPQLGTGKLTNMKVLAAPGTEYREVSKNRDLIQPALLRSTDGGRTYPSILPPISINSKRVKVRYAEEGGTDADGVIYVRPGVKDVSLGKANYAQVRIAVDGTHYLKGMAIYRDEGMPDGVDLVFNTNKSSTGNKLDAMKEMKKDPDDPFGSTIRDQLQEDGPNGTKRVTSVMNIVNSEGEWNKWDKSLSSQALSKQKPALAKHQLDLAYESKKREFDGIMELTNPGVKKRLLEVFSESVDSAAVHLKAANMPRQATKVILPVNSMKPTEIYAPTFRDGERVVLIRFPHGGKFEIPELRVNNRHPEAKKLLGNAPDAVGIHSKVAERLSGADFDGDTVLVIPNNLGKIETAPALEGLKGFDPQSSYPPYDGMKTMSGGTWNASKRKVEFLDGQKPTTKIKGQQMGQISNLITDMTLKGAGKDELGRAVRHSMVVIDAEKHSLNYKQSALDNGIAGLKKKYQVSDTSPQGGAATLISRAKSESRVPDRALRRASEGGPIDPKTGKLVYVDTGAEYQPGVAKTQRSTKLAETDDAHTLSSGMPIEKIYADHSNKLKNLANEARRAYLGIEDHQYSPSAAKSYGDEVRELNASLNDALRNAPLERQAQVVAQAIYKQKKDSNPELDDAELKKLRAKELKSARERLGAKKDLVVITPRQWEAIQAGAITKTKLDNILRNADLDKVKELATPKDKPVMDATMKSRAMRLLRGDRYTLADVADQLGISVTTLQEGLAGGES